MGLHRFGTSHRQQGAALLVSLLLLLGLTIVGIASMRESVTQQRIINAVMEDDTAFQAAEYALRAGEEFVYGLGDAGMKPLSGTVTLGNRSVQMFDALDMDVEWWKDRSNAYWDDGYDVSDYPLLNEAQNPPSYVIEWIGSSSRSVDAASDSNKNPIYRITARGFGVNDNYYVVLQSTVVLQN
jgi:type IV pilus assembly protein PilX